MIDIGGDRWLGGDNFDVLVAQLARMKLQKGGKAILPGEVSNELLLNFPLALNYRALQAPSTRELLYARQLKEVLSNKGTADEFSHPAFEGKAVTITAAELDAAIEASDIPGRIQAVLDDMMQRLPNKGEEISRVLMVGGSSKLPWVKRFVGSYFGESKLVDNFDPRKAVAEGAALEASWLANRFRGEATSNKGKIIHSIPHSLGVCSIWDRDDLSSLTLSVIIPRASSYPILEKQMYYAVHPDQTQMLVEVVEGDELTPGKCRDFPNLPLGNYIIPLVRTDVGVLVEFGVNANGMLEVSVSQEGNAFTIEDTLSKKVGKMSEQASLSSQQLVELSVEASSIFKHQYATTPPAALQTFVHHELRGDAHTSDGDSEQACKEYMWALQEAPKKGSSGALLRILPKLVGACDAGASPATASGDPSCWLPLWRSMRDELFQLSRVLDTDAQANLADAQWVPVLQVLLNKSPQSASVVELNNAVRTAVQELATMATEKSCPKELGYQFAVLHAISASRDSLNRVGKRRVTTE